MSDTTAANPQGAGSDLREAATQIRGFLSKQAEPQGQPQDKGPTVQANQDGAKSEDAGEKKDQPRDPQTKRFVRTEPGAAEDNTPEADADDDLAKDDGAKADTKEAADDAEELAEDVDDFARQLGLEPENLLSHLKAKVKVNGEEKQVNLKELLSGYSMEADYRQKTAKVAEERKAFDAERQQYTQQRDHLTNTIAPLVSELEKLVSSDDERLMEILERDGVAAYEQARIQAEKRKILHANAQKEAGRLAEQQHMEARGRLEQDVLKHEQILIERKPDWAKDEAKGKRELAEIRQYLRDDGHDEQYVAGLYDARILTMADKARKWDALQKSKPEKLNELKAKPKFLKPGPSKPAEDQKVTVHRAALQRLRKTGDWRDAAKAIKTGGFVSRS